MLEPVDVNIYENDELKHWGILGMHWGIRRYQNEDGTLTPEGRERYGVKTMAETKRSTYSQKHETLKYKTDRTPEEEKEFQKLESGKDYYLNTYIPAVMNEKIIDIKTPEDSMKYSQGLEYFLSTNYGKKMFRNAQFSGYLELGGLNKNNIDFYRDMLFYNDKEVNRPVKNEDLIDSNVEKVMKIFGVSKKDLVIAEDGTKFPPIRRKDGKPFKYTDGNYEYEDYDLRNIAWEGDWPMNKSFKKL